jgi:hypothetical protein
VSDDLPILAYATPPVLDDHDGDDALEFEFRSPPFAPELVIAVLAVPLFIAGAVAVFVKAYHLPAKFDWTAMIFPAIASAACAIFAALAWRRARQLMRFGGLPVKITVANGQLILTDPPQWGPHVHAVPLASVARCYGEFGGWTLRGPKIYRINVFVRDRETIELRVATKDSVAVDRAIAAIKSRLPSASAVQ